MYFYFIIILLFFVSRGIKITYCYLPIEVNKICLNHAINHVSALEFIKAFIKKTSKFVDLCRKYINIKFHRFIVKKSQTAEIIK